MSTFVRSGGAWASRARRVRRSGAWDPPVAPAPGGPDVRLIADGQSTGQSVPVVFPPQPAGTLLLLAVAAGSVSPAPPAGWGLVASQVDFLGGYVWSATSTGAEGGATYGLNATAPSAWQVVAVAGGVVAGAMAEHQHSPGGSTSSPAVNAGGNGMVGLGFFSAMRDNTPVARLLENQPPSDWVVLGETAGPDAGDRQSVASVWAEVQPGPVSAPVVWSSLASPMCLIASTVVVQRPTVAQPDIAYSGAGPTVTANAAKYTG